VRAALASWKGHDLAFADLLPAGSGTEVDTAREHDQKLLALKVVVEEPFPAPAGVRAFEFGLDLIVDGLKKNPRHGLTA
jgi:hypothetical protein